MKNIPYIVIIILLIIIFFNQCSNTNKDLIEDSTSIDTLYITKTIPSETIKVVQERFTPIYITGNNQELINKINKLEDKDNQIEYLLKKLETRIYDTTYVYNKGKVKVRDSVQGTLLGREVEVTFDEVQYQEKVITKTTKLYPKFAITSGISTGFTTTVNNQNVDLNTPFIGVSLGFRNQKGYEIGATYNSLKQASISLKKDIFVKYKKK